MDFFIIWSFLGNVSMDVFYGSSIRSERIFKVLMSFQHFRIAFGNGLGIAIARLFLSRKNSSKGWVHDKIFQGNAIF